MTSDYPFGIFKLFLSFILFLLTIVLSVPPKENDNSANNDLQNITQKTKDRAARIPLKYGGCFVICS
jgi:hypothetical protein